MGTAPANLYFWSVLWRWSTTRPHKIEFDALSQKHFAGFVPFGQGYLWYFLRIRVCTGKRARNSILVISFSQESSRTLLTGQVAYLVWSESCKYFGSEPVEKGPEPCKYFFVTYRKSKKISSGHIIVSKNFLRTLLAGQVAYLVLGLQPSTCR